MVIRDDTSTRFSDEVRLISRWAWLVAALGFLTIVGLLTYPDYGCHIVDAHAPNEFLRFICTPLSSAPPDSYRPPKPLMAALAIVLGTIAGCLILLIGYIHGDAARRGMSRALWTLLAVFIPNGIGILLYFLLRKPRVLACPQCRAPVEPGFGFCPQCRHSLHATCPQCQRGVDVRARFCPYCSAGIGTPANV